MVDGRNLRKILFFGLLAVQITHASPLSEKLTGMVKSSVVKESEVGMYIATSGASPVTPIFNLNGENKFIPASVTKIVPAGASLKVIGPTKTFKTRLMSSAAREKSNLKGDLYLVGGGDPGFVTETLWTLVNDFYRKGLTTIEGSIIVDDTLFDDIRFDPSRIDKRVSRAYDAPVGAMSFNWNTINVFVYPGLKAGDAAEVHADPANELITVENKVKTTAKGRLNVTVERRSLGHGKERITVRGQIPEGHPEKVFFQSVTEPALWSGANLKSALALRGIMVKGSVKKGKAPDAAKVISEVESKPVSLIVQDMMKFSNNYVAEMLTKQLALKGGSAQGNMIDGMRVLRQYIESTGVKGKDFELLNPSGYSRQNQFRPVDMVQMLSMIQSDSLMGPEGMASFPLSGLDGTLKSRLKEKQGGVRAKTGLLNGVVSLAGWVQSKNKPLVFTFFYNGRDSHTESAKDLFDKILRLLIESDVE